MPAGKILIVENEAIVSIEIQEKLTELGYPVAGIALSGEEAVKKTGEIKPDLVLMDINLGEGMGGIEAAQEIQSRYNIPVIYLTAYTNEETLQKAKVTKPYGYITKPFNERELYIIIEIALYKHKAETELKILRGILPICVSCKKIRDDKGYWKQIESYIRDRSEAEFSHSLCPNCAEKLYPQMDLSEKE
ncbi:response regulator [Acidobacteriota bacterium]